MAGLNGLLLVAITRYRLVNRLNFTDAAPTAKGE